MAKIWIRRENGAIIDVCPHPMDGYADQEEMDEAAPEYVAFRAAQQTEKELETRISRATEIFIRAIFNPANAGRTMEQIRTQIMQQASTLEGKSG